MPQTLLTFILHIYYGFILRLKNSSLMARLPPVSIRRATQSLIVAIIVSTIIVLLLQRRMYDDDSVGTPTDFSNLQGFSQLLQDAALPKRLVRRLQRPLGLDIDQSYQFVRSVGRGQEGTVALYLERDTGVLVTIKSFHSKRRNRLPPRIKAMLQSENTDTWPTEIPATVSDIDFFVLNIRFVRCPAGQLD